MANPTTAIAVTEKSVGDYVTQTLPALAKSYAVRDYNVSAWMKTAALAIVESKDLMDCLATEAGRISLKHALRFAATTGLSLNPQEGKACLVPKGGKIQYWPMKNGLVELALETGVVKFIRMNAVRDKDRFSLTEGMDGDKYEFSPGLRGRGEIIGFFCAIKLMTGESLVEYMPADEMQTHRKQYSEKNQMTFEDYGIKTVVKRAIKRLALPSAQSAAIEAELAIGDAEPAEFTTSEKGTSAGDVEKKLKESGQAIISEAVAAVSPEPAPASAPAAEQGAQPAKADAEGQVQIF